MCDLLHSLYYHRMHHQSTHILTHTHRQFAHITSTNTVQHPSNQPPYVLKLRYFNLVVHTLLCICIMQSSKDLSVLVAFELLIYTPQHRVHTLDSSTIRIHIHSANNRYKIKHKILT